MLVQVMESSEFIHCHAYKHLCNDSAKKKLCIINFHYVYNKVLIERHPFLDLIKISDDARQ